jgi:hypothetical protein
MTDGADIAGWIRQLADADPKTRAESALRLYLAGYELCAPTLSEWIKDAEFRELALPGGAGGSHSENRVPSSVIVGIAVQPENFEKIRAANGSPRLADVPPEQDAKEFELHFEDHIEFDILTTREPGGGGAIARFLEKFGEGIQQIEIYVRHVDRATQILRTRFGIAPIYPTTHAGADGTRVNFFLVPAIQGKKVLIELVEAKTTVE